MSADRFQRMFPAMVWQNIQITFGAFNANCTIQESSAQLTKQIGTPQQFTPFVSLFLALYAFFVVPNELTNSQAVFDEWLSDESKDILKNIQQRSSNPKKNVVQMLRHSLSHANFEASQPADGLEFVFTFRNHNPRNNQLVWECTLTQDDIKVLVSSVGKDLARMCEAGSIRSPKR